jgi:hypothetical protein
MAAELVLFAELVKKFNFVTVLDCHEHSDTVTAVPPVAVLL